MKTKTNPAGGTWRMVVKGGRRTARSPEGEYFFGTAKELRESIIVPWQRDMVADKLRCMRHYYKYNRAEIPEAAADVRREFIARWRDAPDIDVSVSLPLAVYVRLGAAARYMERESAKSFIVQTLEESLEAVEDLARSEDGLDGIPMTRHERAALARLAREGER